MIYTSPGIWTEDLAQVYPAQPPVRTLPFLHRTHEVFVTGIKLNVGMENGLKVQRWLGAEYWCRTHDEVTGTRGLVAPLLHYYQRIMGIGPASYPLVPEQGLLSPQTWAEATRVELGHGQSLVLTRKLRNRAWNAQVLLVDDCDMVDQSMFYIQVSCSREMDAWFRPVKADRIL